MGIANAAALGPSTDLQALMAGRDNRWYKGNRLKLTMILLLVLITSATNGYDGSMMNGLQSLDTWRSFFGHPENNASLLGILNAIQNIGSICGLPFAPYVSDIMGRRFAIFLGCIIMLVGTALQTAAMNIGMFIAARCLIGFGLSFAGIAAPVLITELAYPTHRAPLTSLYNSSWYLGAIIAAWTTFGTFRMHSNWGWRIPSLLQGLPSILQVLFIWFIPESPRWLISKGKEDQAIAIIAKYHCDGNTEDPLVAFEIDEIREGINQDKDQSGWKDLFSGIGNWRRLRIIVAIAFFSQWSGNGLVSYYLTLILTGIGITSTNIQTLINGILQLWNYFWAIVGALTVDRVGRRPLFLMSTAGMCVSFVCWTICSAIYSQSGTIFDPECIADGGTRWTCVALDANKASGNAVLAFIFLYYAFYDIAMSPLLVSYTVEILPFRIRSKGLMFMQLCVSASLVFNQYANPIALDALHWKYYIVFCVFLAFEFVYCYFFVLETRGPNGALPLEEIAELFDGPGYYGFQKRPAHEGHVSDLEHSGNYNHNDIKTGSDDHVERVASLH